MVELGLKILWCNSILFVHCRASDFFGTALIRGPIQLPQTPQNFKWLTVLSVPLSLSPKLLFGQRLQNCVRNNIPYYFFRWMKFWLKKKCRGISLVPLYFLKKSNAVHPFEEMRYYVISIANKRHCMKMRTCITFLWRWKKIFFFHNSSYGPLLVGRLRQSAATKRGLSRSPELGWHSVAPVLNNNHFRDEEEIYLEERLGKDTEIKVKTKR